MVGFFLVWFFQGLVVSGLVIVVLGIFWVTFELSWGLLFLLGVENITCFVGVVANLSLFSLVVVGLGLLVHGLVFSSANAAVATVFGLAREAVGVGFGVAGSRVLPATGVWVL